MFVVLPGAGPLVVIVNSEKDDNFLATDGALDLAKIRVFLHFIRKV